MLIHDRLTPMRAEEIEELGRAKGLEPAESARSEGGHVDSATGLHSAKGWTKDQLREEAHQHFSGEDCESNERVWPRLCVSRL